MKRNSFRITSESIHENLYHGDTLVLSYHIKYPRLYAAKDQRIADQINEYFYRKTQSLQKHYQGRLYAAAVAGYEDSIKNGYPFHAFEAVSDFQATYLDDCTLSLYFDQYEYTGGAHGSTLRHSDTWDLRTGKRMGLERFFPPDFPYETYIIDTILGRIASGQANGGGFFEQYEQNVKQYYNPQSFYLTPRGIVVYFQQYEIAPYAYGIPEFFLPFSEDTVLRPPCKQNRRGGMRKD